MVKIYQFLCPAAIFFFTALRLTDKPHRDLFFFTYAGVKPRAM